MNKQIELCFEQAKKASQIIISRACSRGGSAQSVFSAVVVCGGARCGAVVVVWCAAMVMARCAAQHKNAHQASLSKADRRTGAPHVQRPLRSLPREPVE